MRLWVGGHWFLSLLGGRTQMHTEAVGQPRQTRQFGSGHRLQPKGRDSLQRRLGIVSWVCRLTEDTPSSITRGSQVKGTRISALFL